MQAMRYIFRSFRYLFHHRQVVQSIYQSGHVFREWKMRSTTARRVIWCNQSTENWTVPYYRVYIWWRALGDEYFADIVINAVLFLLTRLIISRMWNRIKYCLRYCVFCIVSAGRSRLLDIKTKRKHGGIQLNESRIVLYELNQILHSFLMLEGITPGYITLSLFFTFHSRYRIWWLGGILVHHPDTRNPI